MPMLIKCTDKPDSLDLRMEHRPVHLDYLESRKDMLLAGGAVLDDDGKPYGSVLIINTEDKAEAEAFAAADPFAQNGLFETVEVTAWRMAYYNFENKM